MAETQVQEQVEPIETLSEHGRKYIAEVLRQMDGNRPAAASALGISLRGLQYIIARWRREGFEVPESDLSRVRRVPWAEARKRACAAGGGG